MTLPASGELELLRATLAGMGDAVITTDVTGAVRFLNPAAVELTGWTPEKAAGMALDSVFKVIHADSGETMESPVQTVLRDRAAVRTPRHTLLLAQGGSRRPIDSTASPILTPAGDLAGVVLTFREAEERSHAEDERLQAAAERKAHLFDVALSSITDFAYVFDRDGRFLYVNKALLDLWGLSLEEAVGKNFFDLQYPAQLAAQLQRQIQQVIETAQGLSDETPYTSPSGAGGIYEYIFSPVFASDGTVEMVAGSTRDITKRKRAEEALHESRRQLQEVFDTAPAFMAVLRGPDMVFEQVNRAYMKLIGKPTELVGRSLLEALPELSDQPFPGILRSVLETGEPYQGRDVRLFLRQSDGGPLEERWVDFVYQPLREPDGRITGVLAHGVDLTERKRAEKELRESETRFRALIRASSDAIYRMSPDWALMWQLQGQNFLADTVEPNRSWLVDYIHSDDHAHVVAKIREAIRTKSVFEMEHRVRRIDGELGWTFSRAVPLIDERGEIVEWFGAATDITERKLATIELVEVRDQALEASRVKSAFLANISHELRTPLNAIIGYAELVTEELIDAGQEELAADIQSIESSGRHLLTLINDILDLSKIEAGRMELHVEDVPVGDLLEEIADAVRPLALKNSNQLEFRCHAPCGVMKTDGTKLRQILLNLLSNALKFTEYGEVVLEAGRETFGDREWMIFQVSDSGIGISPEQLNLLFRDFTQLDSSTTRRHGGTGLGLAISRRFSQMIGGEISVRSREGEGAIFTLRVPARLEENPG